MAKIRIIFEKKGLFTFVNHMDLPLIFSRAARRAGLVQEFTQGCSPHPRMSLASPLATGVEGLAEPADFWFENADDESMRLWSEMLPEGLKIIKWRETGDGPGLAKIADAAVYRIRGEGITLGEDAAAALAEAAKERNAFLDCSEAEGTITLSVCDLEHCGASVLVKALIAAGVVSGWADLRIERVLVGIWNAESKCVEPVI